MTDNFGDRMKFYEKQETSDMFIPRLPIYARIDGRSFSKFTKGMNRPYDERMSNSMIDTVKMLVENSQALIGYTQSDEISLMFMPEDYNENIIFSGKKQKLVSVLASMTTAYFHKALRDNGLEDKCDLMPHFDCRVFQLPTKTEACNALLWRYQDAVKNSISMAAQRYFTHKQLQRKNGLQLLDMLSHSGVNYNDFPAFFKGGTFVKRVQRLKILSDEEWLKIPEESRPGRHEKYKRSSVERLDIESFSAYDDKEGLIFGDLT